MTVEQAWVKVLDCIIDSVEPDQQLLIFLMERDPVRFSRLHAHLHQQDRLVQEPAEGSA